MNTPTPTKLDIARALGVSRTCVSQVLNQIPNARISTETRRRIMEEAKKRRYLSLPVQRRSVATNAIAYVYCHQRPQYKPSISHIWPQIIQELQFRAMADDRHVVFICTGIDTISLDGFFRSLDMVRPMAIVLDGVVPEAVLAQVRERGIPHVVFGVAPYSLDETNRGMTNTVRMDFDDMVGKLMQWLHGRGCRRIAFSCGLLRTMAHSLVFEAYRKWVDRLGLEFEPALVQFGEDATGSEIVAALGRLGVQHDGLILTSVSRAIRALPYLPPSKAGSHRIRSIGVLGAPDGCSDWLSDMAISGARCSEIARAIYEIISAELNYQTKRKKEIILPSTLVEAI